MGGKSKKNVLSALYDVRPVNRSGHLDVEKIRRIKAVLDLKNEYDFIDYQPSKNILRVQPKKSPDKREEEVFSLKQDQNAFSKKKTDKINKEKVKNYLDSSKSQDCLPDREEILKELESFNHFDNLLASVSQGLFEEMDFVEQTEPVSPARPKKIKPRQKNTLPKVSKRPAPQNHFDESNSFRIEEFYFPEAADPGFNSSNTLNTELVKSDNNLSGVLPKKRQRKALSFLMPGNLPRPKSFLSFILTGFLIALVIPLAAWLGQGMVVKERVMSNSLSAYQNLKEAKGSLEDTNWQKAEQNFALAYNDFNQAYEQIKGLDNLTLEVLDKLPGGDKVSSGVHLIKVGEHLTSAGHLFSSALGDLSLINLFAMTDIPQDADVSDYKNDDLLLNQQNSLTDSIVQSRQRLTQALKSVDLAIEEAEQIKVSALPEDIQDKIFFLKEELPGLRDLLAQAFVFSDALVEILGHDNPRQYLLVFQNNSEIRATGGFIGTYGLLQFDQGRIRGLLVDGIFNADGQLHEKIIPPQPIQKISTAWSMHDANWFPDFPTSAQKIQWFYEKTGGITTDGVWAITPVVVERLLELTGPIKMPDYGVELNTDNFVEIIQHKVEVDYDKRLNRPKKILADFTPLFLNALSDLSIEKKTKVIEIIFSALEEKHILFYFNNSEIEELFAIQGWAGQLKSTQHDYLSVVSSNINGYKTDRMIDESIDLSSAVQEDGSIINTLTITRQHQGGEEEYDWWNQVNSNYLRVYVPEGSTLISAKGHTIESCSSPIDYQENGFKQDALVAEVEKSMKIDSETGTHIFKESGKTVFGNWVYVSPGKKVTIVYQYRLPFKINLTESLNNHSILIQKQAGSIGSEFKYRLDYPGQLEIAWSHPEKLILGQDNIIYQNDLEKDRFLGMTFKDE